MLHSCENIYKLEWTALQKGLQALRNARNEMRERTGKAVVHHSIHGTVRLEQGWFLVYVYQSQAAQPTGSNRSRQR